MVYILYILAVVFLFIIPGFAILSFIWKENPFSFFEKIGCSIAISISVYPIFFLWCFFLGVAPLMWLTWIPGTLALILLIGKKYKKVNLGKEKSKRDTGFSQKREYIFPVILLISVLLLIFCRLYNVHTMNGPAWGDSVHHTHIVQLILDHNGLFQSWEPYAEIDSMTYHFGFHVLTGVFANLLSMPAPQAVLVFGQILNIFAVLVLYPLIIFFTRSLWAGLVGIIFSGFIFTFPGFFLNWGRYTQLTALVILPILLLLAFGLYKTQKENKFGRIFLVLMVFSGLALSHYRVTMLAIAAILAYGILELLSNREYFHRWLRNTGYLLSSLFLSGLCILPWIIHVNKSRMAHVFNIFELKPQKSFLNNQLWVWGKTNLYFSDLFLILAIIILFFSFFRKSRLGLFILFWSGVSFIIANPYLLKIPGRGLLDNGTVLCMIYIPLSLLFSWFFGAFLKWLKTYKTGLIFTFISLICCLFLGIRYQLNIVDPFFQMLTKADLKAFQWIKTNIPDDAYFLVNGFLIKGYLVNKGNVVAGSDAGWWISFYTQRKSNVPPSLYNVESLPASTDRASYALTIKKISESEGNPDIFSNILLKEGITHVFLGNKRGRVAYGQKALIPENWLRNNKDFILVYHYDKTQVWKFLKSGSKEETGKTGMAG